LFYCLPSRPCPLHAPMFGFVSTLLRPFWDYLGLFPLNAKI